ncbi:MAG: DNA polymerase I [Patescibacteria group bacterium]
MSKPTLYLLDANALLHRAWHAIPPMSAPDGTVVNAAYGIASVVFKLISQEHPDAFVACWDTAAKTFRHEEYKEYKATREKKEQELYDQIPIAKELLHTMGIPSFAKDGFEADDLIGTLARIGKEKEYKVIIVTGDRDALQLIEDGVSVLTFKKGVSDTKVYDADAVKEEYGVTPEQLVEWKAIRGDSSDNIPGIKGIGEKGATELVQEYDTFDGIVKAAKDTSSTMRESLREKILACEKEGKQARMLVEIDRHVPIKVTEKDFEGKPDREAFVELAGGYGFRSLIARWPFGEEGDRRSEIGDRKGKGRRGDPADRLASRRLSSKSEKGHACTDGKDATERIEKMSKEKRIAFFAMEQEQGSLFGTGLSGIAMGTDDNSFTIPHSVLADEAVRKSLAHLFQHADDRLVTHDAKTQMRLFDTIWGHEAGRSAGSPLRHGVSHDTLIAAYLLSAGDRKTDLDLLALQLLGKELPKGEDRSSMIAQAILEIAKKQEALLSEEGLVNVLKTFELPLSPVLYEMERKGILLDSEYLASLEKDVVHQRDQIEKKMEKFVDHPFNPASPSQLATILFDELKLPAKGIKKGKTGYSTAASELEKLEGTHPIIQLISDHREVSKLLSTYIQTLPNQADAKGRVHTTFNQVIAATGRLSSSDPNLQNIPIRTELGRKIRRAFVAPRGMRLLSCDYSQIELRVVAALSSDEKMLSAFKKHADIHTSTAADIWGIDPDKVTKEQRRAAKAINFGIIYGQGPMGLSRSAGISFEEAKDFIDRYFVTYPRVRTYLDSMKLMARERGFVETLFGRRRYIPDIHSGMQQVRAAAERMAINMPAQGTAADLMKLAMIKVADGLSKVSADSHLLLQVHDELVLEVPESELEKVATFVKHIMQSAADIGCPIVVDAKAGKNWDTMTKIDA